MPRNSRRTRRRRLLIANLVMLGLIVLAFTAILIWRHCNDKKVTTPTPKPPKTAEVFLWIWQIEEAKEVCGGSLQGIVDKCKENGISGLIVCSNRGGEWFNDRDEFGKLREIADENELIFMGYGRFLAKDPPAEMLRTIEAIQDGADGFIFDMEAEYETPEGAEKASAVVANVKRWCETNAPDVVDMLGYSSFGLPSRHPNFPTEELDELCGFSAPQWYTTSWAKTQGWSLKESQEKIRKEFSEPGNAYAPVLQAYGKNSGYEYVTPDELKAMLKFSGEMEFTTFVSIFRLELMDDEHWQTIREYTGANKRQNKARDRLDSRSRFYYVSILSLRLSRLSFQLVSLRAGIQEFVYL